MQNTHIKSIMQKYEIENIISTLEYAVKVCYGVDYSIDSSNPDNVEYTAPFAIGYSKNAMRTVIHQLKQSL